MTEQSRDERPAITQDMINLFDDYTHLSLDRRKFMDNLAKLAGSVTAASAAVALMASNVQAQGLTSTGQQRFEMLQQRRHDQFIAITAGGVEQFTTQFFDVTGLGRQYIGNVIRQDPSRHGVSGGC